MSEPLNLQPKSAFAGLSPVGVATRKLRLEERPTSSIAHLEARKGRVRALTTAISKQFGIELPTGPSRVESNGTAFIGIGVAKWLVISSGDLSTTLRRAAEHSAAVSDQTGSYGILRLTGPHLRDVLAKFVPLDLHPRMFVPGAAASTIASHIPVILWRLVDGPDDMPVFEIAAPRSYAGSLLHVVTESGT
jgi:heterotetrameric sarcosine oxidase gamma subunit